MEYLAARGARIVNMGSGVALDPAKHFGGNSAKYLKHINRLCPPTALLARAFRLLGVRTDRAHRIPETSASLP